MTMVILLAIALSLFVLAFITRRRYGVLGLGLAAGVVLAGNARSFVSDFYEINRVPVSPLTADAAAIVTLVLLPALLLLISGPAYQEKKVAIIGSVGFALLGTILLLGPVTTALPFDDPGMARTMSSIAAQQKTLVAIAIGLAVLDTILLHNTLPRPKKSKH